MFEMWYNSRLEWLNALGEAIRVSLKGVTHSAEYDRHRMICKLHEEVSEIWRASNRGEFDKPCDKADAMRALGLPVLSCGEEEFADVAIVLFGAVYAEGINIARAIAVKMAYNSRPR